MGTDNSTAPGREQAHPSSLIPRPSLWRAWLELVALSVRRQANARQMVWIALGLLAFATAITAVQNVAGNWGMAHWRWPRFRQAPPPGRERPADEWVPESAWIDQTQAAAGALCGDPAAHGVQHAILGSCRAFVARKAAPDVREPYWKWADQTQILSGLVHRDPGAQGVQHAVLGSCRVIVARRVRTEGGGTASVSGFE